MRHMYFSPAKNFLPLFILGISYFITSLPATASDCYVEDADIRGQYTGHCLNGLANGQGKSIGKDSYQGSFKAGLQEGQGSYQWSSGDTYVGNWHNGLMHGQGVMTWSNGSQYIGNYYESKKNGIGKLMLVQGDPGILSWQKLGKGEFIGNQYVVEGVFEKNALILKCDTQQVKTCGLKAEH